MGVVHDVEPDGAMPPEGLEAVVGRIATGDAAAFRIVVEQTQRELVRLAARLLGSLDQAEDVVQESYVKAYRALSRGQFDARSTVRTWLHSIVTRSAIDQLRGGKRRRALEERARDEPPQGVAASPDIQLALSELAGLLDGLPAEQRVALVLKTVEGRTSKEIALLLGCSEGAVEQRLVRARATLAARQRES